MKNRIRILMTAVCLAMCLAICLTMCCAAAEQEEVTGTGETVFPASRISNEQAEREYLNGLFGLPVTPVEELPRMRGSVSGSQLGDDTPARKLYEALKSWVARVAGGEVSPAVFTYSDGHGYLPADKGVTSNDELAQALLDELPIRQVVQAVMYDCPYEMFWYDKTRGTDINYSIGSQADGLHLTVTLSLYVAKDYSAANRTGTTDLNTARIRSAKTAVSNADAILTANSGQGNYAKLKAYKDAICGLADYNDTAAAGGVDYGDPWQLVWVFDGDDSTTVVCEGYSKAFQYLCDRSRWNGSVEVISVSGTMLTNSGGGNHMWNIVRMNNTNYLADVTNSDAGSAGWAGELFLSGCSDLDGENYYHYPIPEKQTGGSFYSSDLAKYKYDDKTTAMFAAERLAMSATAADPNAADPITLADDMITAPDSIEAGGTLTVTVEWPQNAETILVFLQNFFTSECTSELYERSQYPGDTLTVTIGQDMQDQVDTEPGNQLLVRITAGAAGAEDAEWYKVIPVYPPAAQTDGNAVRLTVPAEPLTVYTQIPITIEAPGAKYVSFFDGENWEDGQEGQPCYTFHITPSFAGQMTLLARAYWGEETSIYRIDPEEWVYSAPVTRTFDWAEGLYSAEFVPDETLMTGGQASVAQGTPLTGVLKAAEGAERYTVEYQSDEDHYCKIELNAEDMENLAAEGGAPEYGRRLSLPTDRMQPGDYHIYVTAYAEGRTASYQSTPFTVTEQAAAGEDAAWIRTDRTAPMTGESVIISAHIPGADHIGVRSIQGVFWNDYFCEAQEGDTATWRVSFWSPGETELQVIGWTEDRWNDENILQNGDDVIQFPDLAPGVSATVNVQTLAGGTIPDVQVTVPDPLTDDSTVTIALPECEGALRYSVLLRRTDNRATVYSKESRTAFTASISGAWIQPGVEYELQISIERYGYTWYDNYLGILREWAPDVPAAIVPGEDVTITIPGMDGANSYEISVEPPASGIAYFTESSRPGTFTIPAAVFADGGNDYVIIVRVSRYSWDELFWKDYHYNVNPYTGTQALTITPGVYTAGQPLTIGLSVTGAEQVIIQEEDVNSFGYSYWTTLTVEDNPGASVSTGLLNKLSHRIRAAVKKNGVWSKWGTAEISTDISGRCNENISWTLGSDGKLTITGTGVIPYEMTDSWREYGSAVTEIEIGSGITGIGEFAFSWHENLTEVTLPASLTAIRDFAFNGCGRLTAIHGADEGRTDFIRCYDGVVKRIGLPSTVEELGYCVFIDSSYGETVSQADFTLPFYTAEIGDYAFQGISARHVKIATWAQNEYRIGDHAFAGCSGMRYFQVDGNEDCELIISGHAFDGCSQLTFIGIESQQLKEYAEGHGFTYLENEMAGGNG